MTAASFPSGEEVDAAREAGRLGELVESPRDFDFNEGGNLSAERAGELNKRLDRVTPQVTSVSAGAWDGLTLGLTHELRIAVFPWASYLTEAWSFGNHREPDGFMRVPSDCR